MSLSFFPIQKMWNKINVIVLSYANKYPLMKCNFEDKGFVALNLYSIAGGGEKCSKQLSLMKYDRHGHALNFQLRANACIIFINILSKNAYKTLLLLKIFFLCEKSNCKKHS